MRVACIFSAASRLAGIVAILLQFPMLLMLVLYYLSKYFKPNLPPAKSIQTKKKTQQK
jgi:hypothetical protein